MLLHTLYRLTFFCPTLTFFRIFINISLLLNISAVRVLPHFSVLDWSPILESKRVIRFFLFNVNKIRNFEEETTLSLLKRPSFIFLLFSWDKIILFIKQKYWYCYNYCVIHIYSFLDGFIVLNSTHFPRLTFSQSMSYFCPNLAHFCDLQGNLPMLKWYCQNYM